MIVIKNTTRPFLTIARPTVARRAIGHYTPPPPIEHHVTYEKNDSLTAPDLVDNIDKELHDQAFMRKINFWLSASSSVIMIGAVVYSVFIIARANSPNRNVMGGFGKSNAKIYDDNNAPPQVKFDDIAGQDAVKNEVRELVDFLTKPEKYTKVGATVPKGYLLNGPSGCGKTLLAAAIAGEANVPFFSVSASSFVEVFVGVGASKVRDLFAKAKERAPCIIFIDEIDAVGKARGNGSAFGGANDEREQTINQLLTELDGFEGNTGIIVIGATNRVDILDKALTRPGRFDRIVHVGLPDAIGRRDILHWLSNKMGHLDFSEGGTRILNDGSRSRKSWYV